MKDSIRIAIIQPKPYPSPEDPRNIGHALLLLEKCSAEELDVVCFPEYFPYAGDREIAAAARKMNAYIIAGMVEEEGGKLLGKVQEVVSGVANDVLELDSRVRLPMVEDCVLLVDIGQARIVVRAGFAS